MHSGEGKRQASALLGKAGIRRSDKSPGEGGTLRAERDGGHWRQRKAELIAGNRSFRCRDSEGSCWEGTWCLCIWEQRAPHLRGPPSVSSPSPAGAAVATLWPGRPEAPATAESRFCAAEPAPVSLTLEPAAYLSNSKGNSAAADGKKITSAAEQGGKRPQPGPRHPPATLPSPAKGLRSRLPGSPSSCGPHTAS